MKHKIAVMLVWVNVFLFLGCDEKENIADLMNDTEAPDLQPDMTVSAIYSEAQQQQIADFEAAKEQFNDLSREDFDSQYGPKAAYTTQLAFNPSDATNLDMIIANYPIEGSARESFESNGFAVLEDKKYDAFMQGFVDVYRKDLPVYFSADAMLDALHLSFDRMLMDVETSVLSKDVEAMLAKMASALEKVSSSGAEDVEETLDDTAVWICTAQSLAAGGKQPCLRGRDAVVNAYLKYIDEEKPATVTVFGDLREEDFSQFKPRGHYTKSEALKKYFKAMMWIQRTGLDFSKYSRHARLAYLLSALVEKGALDAYNRMDETISVLVGVSDSMNVKDVLEIAAAVNVNSIEDLTDSDLLEAFVTTAIQSGAGQQRINSAFLMADTGLGDDEFTPIPPAFHFMGQRFVVDSYVFTNVVYDRVKNPDRYMPSPLDTWFVLGNRETVPLLKDELDTYQYQSHLAALEYLVSAYDESFWEENFYNGWLSALKTLDEDVTSDAYPPVMRTQTWQRRMLNTQLGSWAHLRHDTLLYAKPSYSGVSCEYPDAWVDAYPAFFETVADVALLAKDSLEKLGMFEVSEQTEDHEFYGSSLKYYFSRLAEVSLMLKDIADSEVKHVPLSAQQLEFMNGLVYEEGMCGAPPYSGWYTELLYKFTEENMEVFDPTIADVHTDPNAGEVLHVGTGYPNLMVLAVSTECQNRAYVGPVLSYHEKITGNFERLDDETWKGMLKEGKESRPVWTESFVR